MLKSLNSLLRVTQLAPGNFLCLNSFPYDTAGYASLAEQGIVGLLRRQLVEEKLSHSGARPKEMRIICTGAWTGASG